MWKFPHTHKASFEDWTHISMSTTWQLAPQSRQKGRSPPIGVWGSALPHLHGCASKCESSGLCAAYLPLIKDSNKKPDDWRSIGCPSSNPWRPGQCHVSLHSLDSLDCIASMDLLRVHSHFYGSDAKESANRITETPDSVKRRGPVVHAPMLIWLGERHSAGW